VVALCRRAFLFHINALFFALFGVSDYTARMSAATFGVVLVLLPALLRRELGRVGALVASTLTLISPSTLFYARYIRNDIYMMVWAALMTAALFRYLDSGRLGWLYLGALAVSLAMCSKETAYITGFIGLTFILTLMALHVLSGRALRVLALASVVLLVALALVFGGLRLLRAGQPGDEGSAIPGRLDEVTALAFGILASILLSGIARSGRGSGSCDWTGCPVRSWGWSGMAGIRPALEGRPRPVDGGLDGNHPARRARHRRDCSWRLRLVGTAAPCQGTRLADRGL
jgi:4-amino-4-deoxy-L-arabinose transferase-like glycosyltransferase